METLIIGKIMKKTILLTGATDGIGFETAKLFAAEGHQLLLHGRNPQKLQVTLDAIKAINSELEVSIYVADLSIMKEVVNFAHQVAKMHGRLDVIINNAGIFTTPKTETIDGLDVRFAVNTLAPYLLTKELLPLLHESGRVINLSSAAQASVELEGVTAKPYLSDNSAYAQSKLALTMWNNHFARKYPQGPIFVAVNPASFLASKMVKEAYGVAGNDLSIGADILFRAALDDEFEKASGKYFDNDSKQFADPHSDALDQQKVAQLVTILDDWYNHNIVAHPCVDR